MAKKIDPVLRPLSNIDLLKAYIHQSQHFGSNRNISLVFNRYELVSTNIDSHYLYYGKLAIYDYFRRKIKVNSRLKNTRHAKELIKFCEQKRIEIKFTEL